MDWFFFAVFIIFCTLLVLTGFVPRIKTPMKEGVAVLIYKTAEENIWIGEYVKNGKICVALIACHRKHRIGDEVEIKARGHTPLSGSQES